jgi:uncharacterized protein YecE (DUF72 family)
MTTSEIRHRGQRRQPLPSIVRIGTAGWANPGDQRRLRQPGVSHLEHYSSRFNSVEINSSFYRQHERATYERWAAATGRDFRFSVKIPRSISHDRKLRGCKRELESFLGTVCGLGAKLAVLLLQLPPTAEWDPEVSKKFFRLLRERTDVAIVCEPRHRTWAGARVERLFQDFKIALVSADPARLPRSWELPAGIQYHRLHGSPRVYWSSYTPGYLQALAARITADRAILPEVWCIFDNTAAGAAWSNAEVLNARLRGS